MHTSAEGPDLRSFVTLAWIEIILFGAVLAATAWLVLAG
jgi:hypothetical protein